MERKTCEFCGTEYSSNESKCPVCGKGRKAPAQKEEKAPKQKRRLASSSGGARVNQKTENNEKGWKVAASVLGILVLLGIVAFFVVMDFTNDRFDPNGLPSLMGPIDNAPVTEPAKPEEVQKPEEPQEAQNTEETKKPAEETDKDKEAAPGACTGLTISMSEVTLENAQDKVFLTAVARPIDCKEKITFQSSDEKVATVSDNGMIVAVGPGKAEITVSCGDVTQVCVVTCTFEAPEENTEEPTEETPEEKPEENKEEKPEDEKDKEPAAKPTLSSEDFTFKNVGEAYALTVSNAPEGAAITYTSSNSKVAEVDKNGNVKAISKGNATITVMVGDVKLTAIARCDLPVTVNTGNYQAPYKLSHTDVTLGYAGEKFTISLIDANGKVVEGVGWTASNGSASIDGSTVKAVAKGQCDVSVTFEGQTYTCIVRCVF